jgi:hypothetical protein
VSKSSACSAVTLFEVRPYKRQPYNTFLQMGKLEVRIAGGFKNQQPMDFMIWIRHQISI